MTLPTKTHFHSLVRDMRVVMQKAKLEPDLILGRALAKWCSNCFPGLPPSPGIRTRSTMTSKLNQSVWKTLVQYGAHPLSECSDGMLDRTIADCGFIEQPRRSDPALDKNSTAQVQRAVATDNDSVAVQNFTVQLTLARPTLFCTQAALA